jgi:hypothetical protein
MRLALFDHNLSVLIKIKIIILDFLSEIRVGKKRESQSCAIFYLKNYTKKQKIVVLHPKLIINLEN